jgi:predicted nucleic acid-binding protein
VVAACYVDSSIILSALITTDAKHQVSVETLEKLREQGWELIASTYAFTEVANTACRRAMKGEWYFAAPLAKLVNQLKALSPQALQLALKFLEEGEALIEKNPVQASEKLYKAAGEAVKALAAALELEQAKAAAREGGWWTKLLNRAAEAAAEKLGTEELALWWKAAYHLHVEGSREARLDSEDVKRNLGTWKRSCTQRKN